MTYEELKLRASERGHVRWLKSGLIERLKLTKDGGAICSFSKFTSLHVLVRKPRPDWGPWACEPSDPPTPEERSEQEARARTTKWFVGRDA